MALANNNQEGWHLSAWIAKGKTTVFGVNSLRQSVKFRRNFKDSKSAYCAHAEMDCLNKASKLFPLEGMELHVTRFLKDGRPAISKPCFHCMEHIRRAGIKKVHYFDRDGNWCCLKV